VAPVALYERLMGGGWAQLAAPIRSMHAATGEVSARGRFQIEHGRHVLARLLALVLRLPRQGSDVDTSVVITACADGERWLRTFDGRHLETQQRAAPGSEISEQFGVLELRFQLRPSGESLVYVPREAALLIRSIRLPIPSAWAPRVEAREEPAGTNEIDVDVCVTLPAIGTLITYHGRIAVKVPPE
jgi:hypothetical protein